MKRMGLSIIGMLVLLLIPVASAQDISFLVNGEADAVTLEPGTTLDLRTTVAQGVYIDRIDVTASNFLLQTLIKQELQRFSNVERSNVTEVFTEQFDLPAVLPSGEHNVEVTFYYRDASNTKQTLTDSIQVSIPVLEDQSKLLGSLMNSMPDDVARVLLSRTYPPQLPPIPRELTDEELRDLIGEDAVTLQKVREVKSQAFMQDKKSLESVAQQKVEELLKDIKKKNEAIIEKELHVYEAEVAGNSSVTISKIIVRVTAPTTSMLGDVIVVEQIPKTVAADVSELSLREAPEVILADPIVKWQFDTLPEGQTKEFSYAVVGDLETIESTTVAVGDEPSAFAVWLADIIEKMLGGEQ